MEDFNKFFEKEYYI